MNNVIPFSSLKPGDTFSIPGKPGTYQKLDPDRYANAVRLNGKNYHVACTQPVVQRGDTK